MPGSPLSEDGDDEREVGDDQSEVSDDQSEASKVSDDQSEASKVSDDQSENCRDSSDGSAEGQHTSDDEEEGDSESFEEVHFAKEALKAMFKAGYTDYVIMSNIRQSCSQWRRGKSRYPFAMARIMRQDSEREALRAHGLGKRTRAESDC